MPLKIAVIQEVKVGDVLTDLVKDTKSKWILMKGDTLYWALAPTASWEDISLMKEIIKDFWVYMTIGSLNYDPTQSFITAFGLKVQTIGHGVGGTMSDEEDAYSPIKGSSGFLVNGGRGMGQKPPEPLLSRLNQSYREALALKKANKNEYLEDKLMKELGKEAGGMGGWSYTKKAWKVYLLETSTKKESANLQTTY